MGKGREIGAQLQAWLANADAEPLQPRLLEGLLLDALGNQDPRLRGPIRDLALQPQLIKLLQERTPAVRRSMLDALCEDLRATYSAAVQVELLDLLAAATGLSAGTRPAAEATTPDPARSEGLQALPVRGQLRRLVAELRPLAPALALGFANALVMQWLGGELSRLLPRAWSGTGLVLLLMAVLQLLLIRPLVRLRRLVPISLEDSVEPRRLWRWIAAPWLHRRQGEALLNGLMLLILLGSSPLPLGSLLLRYLLTSLTTMATAVLLARRWLRAGLWDGASGAVAALIALSTGLSLLHWRLYSFPFGVLSVPVWVLFLVYGALQMAWVLPRQAREETAPPWQRLLCSCWCWGSIYGFGWSLLTRLQEWLGPLLRAAHSGT